LYSICDIGNQPPTEQKVLGIALRGIQSTGANAHQASKSNRRFVQQLAMSVHLSKNLVGSFAGRWHYLALWSM
jgi:hypothetical protein